MASFLDSLVGKRPKVPEIKPISLADEQAKAIAENIAAEPGASKLATLNQEQIDRMMEAAIPGFKGIQGQASSNIAALLKGEIPTDVSQEVKRSGAARSLAGGYAGTDAAQKLVARDLGLTSLGLTREGLSSAESWVASMERLYSPSESLFQSMFVTPQQQFAATTQERNLQFQREWLQNQISALPAPWAEDLKQFVYRAMSAYSGSSVPENSYSRPGSFGGGPGGGGGGFAWGGDGGWMGSNASGWQTAGSMGGGTGALGGGGQDVMAGAE